MGNNKRKVEVTGSMNLARMVCDQALKELLGTEVWWDYMDFQTKKFNGPGMKKTIPIINDFHTQVHTKGMVEYYDQFDNKQFIEVDCRTLHYRSIDEQNPGLMIINFYPSHHIDLRFRRTQTSYFKFLIADEFTRLFKKRRQAVVKLIPVTEMTLENESGGLFYEYLTS